MNLLRAPALSTEIIVTPFSQPSQDVKNMILNSAKVNKEAFKLIKQHPSQQAVEKKAASIATYEEEKNATIKSDNNNSIANPILDINKDFSPSITNMK